MNMNRKWLSCLTMASIILFFILVMRTTIAQGTTPTPQLTATPTPDPIPTIELQIENLRNDLTELDEKLNNPQKDVWDKLAAISGLVSGISVAIIGGLATYTYNERKRKADHAHNDRELAVQRVQTTQSFMPQLQSDDPRAVEAAILSISVLDARLATDLATLFRSEGAVVALSKIASSANPEIAKRAETSLDNLFKSLETALVTLVGHDGKDISSGFFLTPEGHVFAPSYVMEISDDIQIKWRNNIYKPELVRLEKSQGTVLFKIDGDKFPSANILPSYEPRYGDKVFALLNNKDLGWTLASGQVIGLDTKMGDVDVPMFITDMKVSRGAGGTPVVNATGEVIGSVFATSSQQDATVILSAKGIADDVEDLRIYERT
ncbi:MAG: trypsin-like peptidase domain-containing protein [Anaerolineaceae bacterium]|nr:trypsin-like peptidase domain-containing protein [Anaerolineaceae bacterium]